MVDYDVQGLGEQAVLIGLLSRNQVIQAKEDAEDGSVEAFMRSLLRKGFMTSWQLDRLLKGDPSGFFYGGCKVLFHIAEGTFARVYRGIRVPGGQSVAVKVLRRRFTTDPESVRRFNQEAESGMKLNHPHIVRIYDFGEADQNHYMVMEYVEGMNLRNFLKLRRNLSAAEALPMMLQLADALKYSLEKGVTHRDIKATNVLISNRGEAKLVDFGLATIEGDEKKLERAHGVRTVDYSALERTCNSVKGDPRSDIFFMGCVFYQMLSGTPPMPETEANDPLVKMLRRNINAIKPISEHSHAPPPGLSRIIERMMKVDLKKRYQTMEEVLVELKEYQGSLEADPTAGAGRAPLRPVARPAKPDTYVGTADDDEDEEEGAGNGAGSSGGGFGADQFEVPAIVPRSILCVEVQETIQDAFRKILTKMGYRVMLMRDPERAAERYEEEPTEVLIFDMDGLGPEALNTFLGMYEKSQAEGHELSALVLLGPKQAGLKDRLPLDNRVLILVKPLKMKDVQEALEQLAPVG